MQKEHTMSDDSLASATETTDLTSAPADTSPVTQSDSGDTATGSATADTPVSDAAAPSQPNTSSTATPTDPLAKVGTFAHNKPTQVTPPTNAIQPPTWEEIQAKLGIKDPKELDSLGGLRNLYGRQANEVGTLRQQLAQLQQEQQTAQQKAQEEAQRLNLSPFHSRHPQHAHTDARVQAFGSFKAALQGFPPELQNDPAARARLAQAMGVTAEDEKLHSQAQQYSADTQRRFQSDPQGFIHNEVAPLMDERFRQFEQYLEAKVSAKNLIQQHQPLIDKHLDRMSWITDPTVPAREKAIWAAQQEEKIAELLATKVPEAQHVETLKARNQLATRQVAPTKAAAVSHNPFAEYEKNKGKDPRAQENLLDGLFGKVD